MFNAVALFPALRDMHYRETADSLYSSWMFLLTYIAHIVPFAMLASMIFSAFTYWYDCLYCYCVTVHVIIRGTTYVTLHCTMYIVHVTVHVISGP